MSAPQLTDPGASSEWFRTVDDAARESAAARRKRFQRLVTYTMVALTGFAVLGLGSYAWRRHSLQAALAAPPPVAPAPVAVAAAPPVLAAQAPAPPEAVPPPPAAAAQPPPAPKPVAARAKPTKKSGGAFLKSLKPQPAKIQRR